MKGFIAIVVLLFVLLPVVAMADYTYVCPRCGRVHVYATAPAVVQAPRVYYTTPPMYYSAPVYSPPVYARPTLFPRLNILLFGSPYRYTY